MINVLCEMFYLFIGSLLMLVAIPQSTVLGCDETQISFSGICN